MAEGKTLAKKIEAIYQELKGVPKNGFNSFSNYKYVMEADLTDYMREILANHGVVYQWTCRDVHYQDKAGKDGKGLVACAVTVVYTLINADNPEERLESVAYGYAHDSGDKALYKALTGAHKYYLFRAFCVGADDDAEKDSPEVGMGAARAVSPIAGALHVDDVPKNAPRPAQAPRTGGMFPAPNWDALPYRYNIPYGKMYDRARTIAKGLGFRFRGKKAKDGTINPGGDNLWYGAKELAEATYKDENGQDITVDFSKWKVAGPTTPTGTQVLAGDEPPAFDPDNLF